MARAASSRVLWATALAALAAAAAVPVVVMGSDTLTAHVSFPRVMALIAVLSAAYLATQIDVAWTFSAAIALSVFSGNADRLGFPIGPDRLAFAFGLAVLVWRWRPWASSPHGRPALTAPSRPLAWLLALAVAYAISSAAWAGTLTRHDGLYGLLDRFGIVPFAMFLLAPTVFATERQRMVLLGALVALGGYLGVTAVAEGLNIDQLVFPSYILDPSVGIHGSRARGPFVEAVANGLGLIGCGAAAAVALARWRDAFARAAAMIVLTLCAAGVVLTLTRAVWLAAIIAPVIALLCSRATRRLVLPATVAAALVAGAAFVAVPGLGDRADARAQDERPIWDRLNTDAAALRMIEVRPLQGYGWNSFAERSPEYMRQAESYPLTGAGLVAHNVFLSHAVELGLIGAALWALAFCAAIFGPILRRAGPLLEPWRLGLVALAVAWVVVASFGPLGYAFPTLLLWTWAGVVATRQRGAVSGAR
jgi:putative inorganic carbon (HCO3(-)) transporter